MSLLTEYFIAASDAEATGVLVRPSGPAGGPAGEPGGEVVPSQSESGLHASGPRRMEQVLDGGGIEPVLQMLVLESILTGRSEEDIEDDRTGDELIGGFDADGPSIVKLSDELMTALTGAGASDLLSAAASWADSEEFNGSTDAETLMTFLDRLARLARSAADRGAGLYCWVSP